MAKKKTTPTPQPEVAFTLEDAVRQLRAKGFDDNRIAAMLMTQVAKVKEIK
jgi:predicted metal-dependent phosphotriesterase family hydrolase